MTQAELEAWVEFYRLFPFDDRHRFYRPAALIAQSLGGGKIEDRLTYLDPEVVPRGMTAADMNTLKAFGLKPQARK